MRTWHKVKDFFYSGRFFFCAGIAALLGCLLLFQASGPAAVAQAPDIALTLEYYRADSQAGSPSGSQPGTSSGTPSGSSLNVPSGSRPDLPSSSSTEPLPGSSSGSSSNVPSSLSANPSPDSPSDSSSNSPSGTSPGSHPGTPSGSQPDVSSGSSPAFSPAPLGLAVLWLEPPAGYYTYSHAEQNSGFPTEAALLDASGAPIPATVVYPPGLEKDDPLMPGETSFIYDVRTPLLIRLDSPLLNRDLRLELSLLLCSPGNCTPVRKSLDLRLNAARLPELAPAQSAATLLPYAPQLTEALQTAAAPHAAGPGSTAHTPAPDTSAPSGNGAPSGNDAPPSSNTPQTNDAPSGNGAPQPGGDSQTNGTPHLTGTPQPGGTPQANGALAQPNATPPPNPSPSATLTAQSFSPEYFIAELEVGGLFKALVLGFLAGLLLNVMPCVLPVASLKLSGLLFATDGLTPALRRKHFRNHNLLFSLGILAWFLALAVVLGAAGLIWGQLFQKPGLILTLLALVFLLGLSMFGVFTLPILDLKAKSGASSRLQPFFNGLLATLLATPCSGPLLGGVLGWAFQQGAPRMTLVFLAVGWGMAAPYLILAVRPGLVRFLPRPGQWMLTLERLVGFFLMGTAIYLYTLLPADWQIPSLITLLVAALSAWIWGTFGHLGASTPRRILAGVIALVLTLGTASAVFDRHKDPFEWEPFNQAEFSARLGKEPLLLEFTADWCPSCKFLEYTTLTAPRMARLTARHSMRAIRVDLTREAPETSALLQALSAHSIPFVALFPKGEKSASPLILRDLFTGTQLEQAADQAFGTRR